MLMTNNSGKAGVGGVGFGDFGIEKKQKNSFFSKLSLLSSKSSIGESKLSLDKKKKMDYLEGKLDLMEKAKRVHGGSKVSFFGFLLKFSEFFGVIEKPKIG